MFEFWFEKLIARLIPVLVFLSIFAVLIYAFLTTHNVAPANEAPFIQEMRSEVEKQGVKTLATYEKPHMGDGELKEWISNRIPEALSFNKDNFSENAKVIRVDFTEEGFQKYQSYLLSSGIAESIRANNYEMSVYLEGPPLFLNSKVIQGYYKWLYELPVVVSFYPAGDIEMAQDVDKHINRRLRLNLQLTRGNVNDNPYAVQIEDWNVVGR